MLQRTLHNIGDDFHVTVRMHPKAVAAGDEVFVHHAQASKMDVLRVVVIGERKMYATSSASRGRLAPVFCFANADHGTPFIRHNSSTSNYIPHVKHRGRFAMSTTDCPSPSQARQPFHPWLPFVVKRLARASRPYMPGSTCIWMFKAGRAGGQRAHGAFGAWGSRP